VLKEEAQHFSYARQSAVLKWPTLRFGTKLFTARWCRDRIRAERHTFEVGPQHAEIFGSQARPAIVKISLENCATVFLHRGAEHNIY
jgi:hypothetical protein